MKYEEKYEDDFSFSETEDKATGQKRMKIIACVQEADKINKNGRLYPRKVLNSAAAAFQYKLRHRAFGQVDHPQLKQRLQDTSHIVQRLFWDTANDKKLNAELLILDTPSGQVLKEIVRANGKPGLSSRGQGLGKKEKVDGKDAEVIQPGFRFDSFDFVIDPSVKNAGIKRVIESANGKDTELLERLHSKLQSAAGIKKEDIQSQKTTDRLHSRLRAMAGIKEK